MLPLLNLIGAAFFIWKKITYAWTEEVKKNWT